MKRLVLLSMMIICLLVGACQPGLPKEAKKALDKAVWELLGTPVYSVVSSLKASKPNTSVSTNYDEVWCIVIRTPETGDLLFRFGVTREELMWSVYRASQLGWEIEDWLMHGCNNWYP